MFCFSTTYPTKYGSLSFLLLLVALTTPSFTMVAFLVKSMFYFSTTYPGKYSSPSFLLLLVALTTPSFTMLAFFDKMECFGFKQRVQLNMAVNHFSFY